MVSLSYTLHVFFYKHIIYKHTRGSFWENNKHIVQIDKHIAEAQIEKNRKLVFLLEKNSNIDLEKEDQ